MAESWLSRNFEKFLWPVLMLVAGGVLSPLLLSRLQSRASEIVVRQFYNTVEPSKVVPRQIGGLFLDYQTTTQDAPRSIYLVEVSNEGDGPEEDLRLQIGFPPSVAPTYSEEPDFRVYRPEEISLGQNKFFMSLKQFPKNARAPVAFEFGDGGKQALCAVKIKAVGKEKEGRVESLKGILCREL